MSYGHNQLDVSHTLATYLLLGYHNTTTVTYDTFVTYTLVLTAMALVISYRTKDAFAEQSVTLGLISTVVDCFGFQHLATRISRNLLRWSKTDGYLRKIILCLIFFSESPASIKIFDSLNPINVEFALLPDDKFTIRIIKFAPLQKAF